MSDISAMNMKKRVERLEEENRALRARLESLGEKSTEPKTDDSERTEAGERMSFRSKKEALKTKCTYGLYHFCDGTPNKSEKKYRKKPPCPNYRFCALRAIRVDMGKDE